MLSTLPLFYIAQSVNSDDRRTRIQGLRVIMLDSGPVADAMLQSTRSQEQRLPIELPLLLKIACISLKQVHLKRIWLVSHF